MQNSHGNSHFLTVEQQNAIDLLVTGLSDQAVAEGVGVARETVTRWRNGNVYFQAALNRRRQEVWRGHQDRLRSLVGAALDTLERALKEGDSKAAVAVLKGAGHEAAGPPGGPTDPEAMLLAEAKAWAEATAQAEWEAQREGMTPDQELTALLQDLQSVGDATRAKRVRELTRQRLEELRAGQER